MGRVGQSGRPADQQEVGKPSSKRRLSAPDRADELDAPHRAAEIHRLLGLDECRRVAYAIAHSPLVKTAFFASDPNLGRILAAIGNSGVAGLDTGKVDLYIDEVRVALAGARDPAYREEAAIAAMKKPEFRIRVLLHRGAAAATVWTCDLSFDYVKINAEYRT